MHGYLFFLFLCFFFFSVVLLLISIILLLLLTCRQRVIFSDMLCDTKTRTIWLYDDDPRSEWRVFHRIIIIRRVWCVHGGAVVVGKRRTFGARDRDGEKNRLLIKRVLFYYRYYYYYTYYIIMIIIRLILLLYCIGKNNNNNNIIPPGDGHGETASPRGWHVYSAIKQQFCRSPDDDNYDGEPVPRWA